jgi:hypothetical protein
MVVTEINYLPATFIANSIKDTNYSRQMIADNSGADLLWLEQTDCEILKKDKKHQTCQP